MLNICSALSSIQKNIFMKCAGVWVTYSGPHHHEDQNQTPLSVKLCQHNPNQHNHNTSLGVLINGFMKFDPKQLHTGSGWGRCLATSLYFLSAVSRYWCVHVSGNIGSKVAVCCIRMVSFPVLKAFSGFSSSIWGQWARKHAALPKFCSVRSGLALEALEAPDSCPYWGYFSGYTSTFPEILYRWNISTLILWLSM